MARSQPFIGIAKGFPFAPVWKDPPPRCRLLSLVPSLALALYAELTEPLRGTIAAVEVKFPFVEIDIHDCHRFSVAQIYQASEFNVAMCGDDDAVRNGGETAEGALAAWSELHKGVSRNLWSDRLSLKSACGLRVSRPLRAVSRRPLEVDISGWPSAEVESVQRLSAHRGQGWAYYQGAQGVV